MFQHRPWCFYTGFGQQAPVLAEYAAYCRLYGLVCGGVVASVPPCSFCEPIALNATSVMLLLICAWSTNSAVLAGLAAASAAAAAVMLHQDHHVLHSSLAT